MPAPVLQFKRGNAGVAGTVPALRPGEPAISLNNFDFFIGIDTSVANNKFFGSHRYWGREDGTNALNLKLVDKDGTNYVAIKAPNTLGGNVTYTLPGIQGSTSTVLTNDGSGNLTWSSGSANPVFTGIATFTDTTDNTLGDANTGSVQIDGGLGVNKNVTVGGNLNVQGYSEFVGVVTFKGGTINLGDSDTDDIVFGGEIKSNIVPTDDATYDIGISGKRWRNASFSGVGTFADGAVIDAIQIGISSDGIIDTSSGNLVLHSATGTVEVAQHFNVLGDLDVSGNVYIGGTTVTLRGTDVFIENKDIVLGYTTSVTPNDTTANHAGVAIASTEGTPLISFAVSGINTLPDTYKQMMWFKSGTLGFSTDMFAFNYGVAIGTTTVADGTRLAVGSDVTVTDTTVSAPVGNFTTLTGSLTGTISTATRATLVDTTTATNGTYYPALLTSSTGTTSAAVNVDAGISYASNTDTLTLTGDVAVNGGDVTTTATTATVFNTNATTVNAFGAASTLNFGATTGTATLSNPTVVGSQATQNLYNTVATNLNFGGDATALVMGAATGITTVSNNLTVGGDIRVNGNDIQASDGNTNITLTSNTLTTFAGDIKVGGNDLQASDGNTNITLTSNTLTTFAGDVRINGNDLQASDGNTNITLTSNTLTAFAGDIKVGGNDIQASNGTTAITLSSADVTVAGDLQITGNDIKSSSGDIAITLMSNDVTIADDLTVNGNLYVQGSTTQVNTAAITVEDRTIELGRVDGLVPSSSTTWDLGVLFNYNASGAKKSAVVWEHSATRFQFASVLDADTNGTDVNTPQLTVNTFAPIEIGSLWVTDCAGTSQVISCTGSTRNLENITIDAGLF
jgi:hypothetical protein